MLSAAHVLAMDSKNLLDVIDGVKIKHGLVTFLTNKHSKMWFNECYVGWLSPSNNMFNISTSPHGSIIVYLVVFCNAKY